MKYLSCLPLAAACGFLLTLCLPALAQAATLNVPSSAYPTIQSAVSAASDGDTVLIADGADGKMRVLWDNADGTASLWDLDNAAGLFSQFTYGPYSHWTAESVSGS
jgi:hypothetical protein